MFNFGPKTTAKKCLRCGKEKSRFAYNYAGYDIQKSNSYAHPEQLTPPSLPGRSRNDFLCSDCANKTTIQCKKHGVFEGRFAYGGSPSCPQCNKHPQSKWEPDAWENSQEKKELCELSHVDRHTLGQTATKAITTSWKIPVSFKFVVTNKASQNDFQIDVVCPACEKAYSFWATTWNAEQRYKDTQFQVRLGFVNCLLGGICLGGILASNMIQELHARWKLIGFLGYGLSVFWIAILCISGVIFNRYRKIEPDRDGVKIKPHSIKDEWASDGHKLKTVSGSSPSQNLSLANTILGTHLISVVLCSLLYYQMKDLL